MVVPIRLAKRTCEGRLTGPGVEATLKIRGQLTLRRAKVAGEVREHQKAKYFFAARDIWEITITLS
jgi:hypothetical protein